MEITTDTSLFEIVTELKLIDAGVKDITPDDHKALSEVIRTKVDRCVAFTKDIAARIQRHKDFEEEHKAARQYLESSLERFNEYVIHTMQSGGFEKLPGEEFVFGTRKSESVSVFREVTEQDAEMMPELVTTKTSHAWNKTAIKEALKSGSFPIDFAGIKVNHNLTVKVK